MIRPTTAFVALHPGLATPPASLPPAHVGDAYATVDLLRFGEALDLLERGYGLARLGFTTKGIKWVELVPGSALTLSHLVLRYHQSYPNCFAGKSVPWLPARCDLFEPDWYVHPLAPTPPAVRTGYL